MSTTIRLNSTAVIALMPFEIGPELVKYIERVRIKGLLEQKYSIIIEETTPASILVEMLLSTHYNLDAVRVVVTVFKGVMTIEDAMSLLGLFKHQQ